LQNRGLFLDDARNMQHSRLVETEFDSLEAKVVQIVTLCERLRAENNDLRQQLVSAQGDAKRLTEKIDGARVRIEQLVSRLPD
jgi:cell division protein ZapB